VQEFISEDDLGTFSGWLRNQAIDLATATPAEVEGWQQSFLESQKRIAATPKVGLMNLRARPGEHLYAVAVREGGLWLVAWVKRSPKPAFFVIPAARRSRLGRSHKLPQRRPPAHKGAWSKNALAPASTIDGHVPRNGEPRRIWRLWTEKRRSDLRPGGLLSCRRNRARSAGTAPWNGGSRSGGTRMRPGTFPLGQCRPARSYP
jgi:hypothetical protein